MLTFNSFWFSLESEESQEESSLRKSWLWLCCSHFTQSRERLLWGKSAFLDPILLQLGNSKDKANRWFHSPYPQQLWHSRTPSCLFHVHPWWPFLADPCPAPYSQSHSVEMSLPQLQHIWCQTPALFPLFGAGSFLGEREGIIASVPVTIL